MQASELRIGNLVYDLFTDMASEVQTIRSIGKEFISTDDYKEIVPYDKIGPILLNEQWLKRFGWNNLYDTGTKEESERPFTGYIKDGIFKYELWNDMDAVHKDIKYVHELQNLHFSLTGEELNLQNEEILPENTK